MTAQIPDRLLIDGQEYAIAAIQGEEPFKPSALGLTTVAAGTACWRGYLCGYRVADGRLVLDRLSLRLGHLGDPTRPPPPAPEINGVSPVVPEDGRSLFNAVYENLGLELKFTGRIHAGQDFVTDLYEHMGFAPAWKFRTVRELVVERGVVTQNRDVSQEMARLRREMTNGTTARWWDRVVAAVKAWIKAAFRRDRDV
jgi:hypothetical protein